MLIISELRTSLKIACTKTNIRCWILSQGNRGRKNQSVTKCIKITEKCQTSYLLLLNISSSLLSSSLRLAILRERMVPSGAKRILWGIPVTP